MSVSFTLKMAATGPGYLGVFKKVKSCLRGLVGLAVLDMEDKAVLAIS